MSSPLMSCSGRVPGNVHMAWARWPNTAASTVETLEPMMYFLSPEKKNGFNALKMAQLQQCTPVLISTIIQKQCLLIH